MSLNEYQRKRDFRRTREPAPNDRPGRKRSGKTAPRNDGASAPTDPQFVVQKHAARRLHYDFRLELDGVLKSWAVPKGPSLDPADKALAVHVEDHPLEYATFEGTIPAGQYGGGTVMLWDRGTWRPEGDPAKGYRRGRLSFQLQGEKLRGGWSLVRMSGQKGDGGKNWLLVKRDDEYARPDDPHELLQTQARSVESGREMEQIAEGAEADARETGRSRRSRKQAGKKAADGEDAAGASPQRLELKTQEVRSLAGARKAEQPDMLTPQLATLSGEVPAGERWLHELKLDGYRLVGILRDGSVRLLTRKGNDWTERFVTISNELSQLPVAQAIVDGEVVALREDGTSDFQALQNSMHRGKEHALVYYLFDLPHCAGFDLTRAPLKERKTLLARLLADRKRSGGNGVLRYSDHIQGTGSAVIEHACRFALEGIISKRADSRYESRRSTAWRKVKCLRRQEFVIGGYTRPSGSRSGFGALLVGYYDGRALQYAGRVGTGFTRESLEQLSGDFEQLQRRDCPFARPSAIPRGGITWVQPRLVAEVEFAQWTEEGLLRHASFQGLREDKSPEDVVREEPAGDPPPQAQRSREPENAATGEEVTGGRSGRAAPRQGSPREASPRSARGGSALGRVRLSNPQRVLYPAQGLTKSDLAEFYTHLADWILPDLVDRPLVLVRCPQGRQKECFYQKHLTEAMPSELRGVEIREKDQWRTYAVLDDLDGLISLVQLGALELHAWGARTDRLERPDRLVFDLDPGEGASWSQVVQAARDVRDRLDQLGLQSFLRTTGGNGLHVVVPVQRRKDWDEAKRFARGLATGLARQDPERYTATMSKAKRRGRVFIDYLRNDRGATAIASYSTRARRGAPVAVPVRWDELPSLSGGDHYHVKNLPRRLGSLKEDPWQGFSQVRQSITKAMMKDVGA